MATSRATIVMRIVPVIAISVASAADRAAQPLLLPLSFGGYRWVPALAAGARAPTANEMPRTATAAMIAFFIVRSPSCAPFATEHGLRCGLRLSRAFVLVA